MPDCTLPTDWLGAICLIVASLCILSFVAGRVSGSIRTYRLEKHHDEQLEQQEAAGTSAAD